MKHHLLKILFFTLSLSCSAAETPASYPDLFATTDHRITVLPIGGADVLIEVVGVNDVSLDGKIFRHTKLCQTTRCEDYIYTTTSLPGRTQWWTLEIKKSYGWESATFIYPGMAGREAARKLERDLEFDSTAFYQRYQNQNHAPVNQ